MTKSLAYLSGVAQSEATAYHAEARKTDMESVYSLLAEAADNAIDMARTYINLREPNRKKKYIENQTALLESATKNCDHLRIASISKFMVHAVAIDTIQNKVFSGMSQNAAARFAQMAATPSPTQPTGKPRSSRVSRDLDNGG